MVVGERGVGGEARKLDPGMNNHAFDSRICMSRADCGEVRSFPFLKSVVPHRCPTDIELPQSPRGDGQGAPIQAGFLLLATCLNYSWGYTV